MIDHMKLSKWEQVRIDINMDSIEVEKKVIHRPVHISRSEWLGRWEHISKCGWIKNYHVINYLKERERP